MSIFLAPVIAGSVTFGLLAWMLGRKVRLPLDHPNERSLHEHPIPRSGGIAIMAGAFCAFAVLMVSPVLVVPVVLLASVSFLDDFRGLPVALRFGVHALAATGFAYAAFPDASIGLLALVILSTLWMTNLYNFMDGSDGLAGGMTVFGFGFLGIAAWAGGSPILGSASFAIAASGAVFLVYNFHPARVFMGDTGSVSLGFLAAAIGATGWRDGLWPVWFAPVIFSPFIVDASLTIVRRLVRGEHLWVAHRDHYYQRLVLMGWGHRNTALAEYALMAACGLAAFSAIQQPLYLHLGLGAALGIVYLALVLYVTLAWRRFHKNKQ